MYLEMTRARARGVVDQSERVLAYSLHEMITGLLDKGSTEWHSGEVVQITRMRPATGRGGPVGTCDELRFASRYIRL
jgi:hypothetical protein